jgi:hypothetical protein
LEEIHVVTGPESAVGRIAVGRQAVCRLDFRIGQGQGGYDVALQIVADIAESLCFYGLGFKIVEEIVIITLDRVVGIVIGHDRSPDDVVRRIVADGLDGVHVDIRFGRVIVADLDEAGVVIEKCGGCHETEDAGKCDCQSGNFFEHKTYFLSLSLPIEAVYTYIISES